MVIFCGKFLVGEYNFVFDEIVVIKEVCGNVRLKVIFEIGELVLLDQVWWVSDIVMYVGVDFIKIFIGKIQLVVIMQVIYMMFCVIRDFYWKMGVKVGMKLVGGIFSFKLVFYNLVMVKEMFGNGWLNNEWFCFGVSFLVNDVLM